MSRQRPASIGVLAFHPASYFGEFRHLVQILAHCFELGFLHDVIISVHLERLLGFIEATLQASAGSLEAIFGKRFQFIDCPHVLPHTKKNAAVNHGAVSDLGGVRVLTS
jgi:hypothetical protein